MALIAVAESLGVAFVVPGWLLLLTAVGAMITTTYAATKIIQTVVVKPTQKTVTLLRDEIRAWMATTDLVQEQGPKWDQGLAELAKAVKALSTVTASLGHAQADIAMIREQVTIDSGDSLKDRIIALSESHVERVKEVDRRLSRLDAHLRRQDSKQIEAAEDLGDHLDRQDATRAGEADELDDHLDAQDVRHDATHREDPA